jgi:prepilin-type N-terminal cleavage/methylation domain-containing protein
MNKQLTINNLQFTNKKTRGFTLIELLVVISIIGILAALALASFTTAQKQARDTGRKSDLKQYQTALEAFAGKTGSGLYPSTEGGNGLITSGLCTLLGISNTCPQDPKTGTYDYHYVTNGTGSLNVDASEYILSAYLEGSSNYFILCSNGKAGTFATQPGGGDLPCPI